MEFATVGENMTAVTQFVGGTVDPPCIFSVVLSRDVPSVSF